MLYIYRNHLCCTLLKTMLLFKFEEKGFGNYLSKPKLRTFTAYVASCLSGNQRSLVVQMKTGIPPLAINIQEENKLYELCDLGEEESESFLLYCTIYDDLRVSVFQNKTEIFRCTVDQKMALLSNLNVF